MSDSGVVAILFTDVVGSTDLLARLGDDAAELLRREHFELLRHEVARYGGEEVKSTGDGLMVAFHSPLDAVGCAVAIQEAVARRNRASADRAIGVRVGLNIGQPARDGDDYYGLAVNVAKRLCDRAQGAQILATELVAGVLGSRGGFRFVTAGRLALKGVPEPVGAVVVEWSAETGESRPLPVPTTPAVPRRPRGPRLVGREAELAVLEAEFERAALGEFRCVLVTADPGVGKTRLSAELTARHPAAVTVSARAYPLGGTASFGLWAEALDGHLRRLTPGEVVDVCGGLLDDLAALVRSVAAVRGSAPDREPSRSGLLEALAVVVANMAAMGPLVVVLDDVHWADASSWDGLRYLADNIPTAPVLVLAVARPAELAEQQTATEVILGLEQDEVLTRLGLRPLDRQGTADLIEAVIGRPPPEATVDWVADRALGNPLFALGLVRALLAEGADLAAPALRSIPESLTDRVMARVKLLEAVSRDTLEVLALLGARVELDGLAAVTGRPAPELGPVLDGLVRSRLVTEADRGPELAYEIAHPLVQETIVAGLGAARRRSLHRQVGRALLAAGRLGEAAPHFGRAGDIGDSEAVAALTAALRQAEERDAYRESLALIGSLAELLAPDDNRWVAVADTLAWPAEWVVDHRTDVHAVTALPALRMIDRVLEGDHDPARRAKVKYRLMSFLDWGTGEVDEAARHGRLALELFEAAGDPRSALLTDMELAWTHTLQGNYSEAGRATGAVVDRARAAGERGVELQAVMAQGFAALWGSRLGAAKETFETGLALAREMGNVYRTPYTLAVLALIAAAQGRVRESPALLAEAKSLGLPYHDGLLVEWESWVHWLAGDFRAAAQSALETVAWHPEGLSLRRWLSLGSAPAALVELGRVSEARRLAVPPPGDSGTDPWMFMVELSQWLEGFLAWREGSVAEALSSMTRAGRRLVETGAWWQAALVLSDEAEAAGDAGDAAGAGGAAARLETCARMLDLDLFQALASTAAAWAHLAAGRSGDAATAAERAVDGLRPLGYRAFLARALDVLGRAHSGIDPQRAAEARTEAARLFDECGAGWRRDRALGVPAGVPDNAIGGDR
jgi:class 3 adenylate cyclase/tetratricopeptide (TPR) repeat protein